MICLGCLENQKHDLITSYLNENDIDKIYLITNNEFEFSYDNLEIVKYKDIIEYAYYYRLIEDTTRKTLFILNDIHKSINRNNLSYNCIRTFLNNTKHKIIFNFFPIIYERNDFCSLIDFETQTKFKYLKFDEINKKVLKTHCNKINITLTIEIIEVSNTVKQDYEKYKEKMFNELGDKDAHTLPRNMQLFTSKIKANTNKTVIGRTKRNNVVSFESNPTENLHIIDLPYNISNLLKYIQDSNSYNLNIITTNLKVDLWFLKRVEDFISELNYVYNQL